MRVPGSMNVHAGLFLLTGALALGAGCEGCETDVPREDAGPGPRIVFDTLPQSINCSDDTDEQTPGEQLEIEVALLSDDGSGYETVTVTTGGVDVTATFDDKGRATVVVTLTGAADPGAENVLTAKATNGTDVLEADAATIVDTCVPPAPPPAACAFESPVAGTRDSAVIPVRVRMSGGDPADSALQSALRTGVVRIDAAPGNASQALQAQAFVAEGTIDVATAGTFDLTATVVGTDPAVTCDVSGIDVVLAPAGATTISFPVADTTYGAADDGDQDLANGITLAVSGTSTVNGTGSFSVTCTNQAAQTGSLTLTPSGNGFAFEGTMTDLTGPDCTVTVSIDSNAPVSLAFHVDAGLPTLDLALTPDTNGDGFYDLPDDADGATAAVIDVPLTVTPTLPVGTWTGTLTLIDQANAVIATVDLGLLVDGQALDTRVPLPVGDSSQYTYSVVATESSGIASSAFTGTAAVDTVAPAVAIFAPANGSSVNIVNDADPAALGQQVLVTVQVPNDIEACTITVDGVDTAGTPAFNTCTALVTLSDGSHTLTSSAVDAAGHVGAASTVTFNSDGTAPAVSNIVVVAAGPDNILNVADNGNVATNGNVSSAVTVAVSAEMDGRVVTATTAGGTCTGTAAGASVTLANCSFPQGNSEIVISGTDAAGNAFEAAGTQLTLFVDTVRPSLSIVDPAGGAQLLRIDDADSDAGNGLQYDVVVASDADGRTVDILDNGSSAGTGSVSSGGATVRANLGEGSRSLTATVSDAAGNITTATAVAVNVDSIPPTLTLACPAPVNTITDESAATAGIQSTCTVTSTGLEAGRTIEVSSSVEGPVGTAGAAANGSTDIQVTYLQEATHDVTAAASDAAGNQVTSNTVSVPAATGLYNVAMTSPPVRGGLRSIGVAEDSDAAAAGAQVIVTGTTDAPTTAVVEVLIDGIAAASTCSISSSVITCTALTLADSRSGTIELTVDDGLGKTGTSGVSGFHVDLSRPTVTFTNPAGAAQTFNRAADLQLAAAGLQLEVSVAVTDCQNGTLTVRDGATGIGTASVGATGSGTVVVSVSDSTEGDGETWSTTCVDADGNSPVTTDSFLATVDITPPTTPTLTLNVLSIRRGEVSIAFTEPGDQGNTGNATTLQVIGSRSTIDAASFDTLAARPNNAGNGGTFSTTVSGGGTSRTVTASGLAFDNAWNFAVRAVDDVGNSALATASLSSAAFATTRTTKSGAAGDTFGGAFGGGDLNGDGFNDIVVTTTGANASAGGLRILGGGGGLDTATERVLAAPANSFFFGFSAAVLDLDGDTRSDLVVTGFPNDFSDSRVFVFYGVTATSGGSPIFVNDAPDAILTNTTDLDGDFLADYNIVQPVGDVSGDGVDDFILTSAAGLVGPSTSTVTEVLLVRGSGTRLASGNLFTQTANTRIQLGSASGGATSFLTTATGLGQLDGDVANTGELVVVTDGASTTNQLWTIAGRTTWPASLDLGTVGGSIACPGSACGALSISSGDVNGDGSPDLVVPAASSFRVHLAANNALSTSVSYTIGVNGMRLPAIGGGAIGVVGDVNGDGHADIAAARIASDNTSRYSVYFGDALTVNRTAADTEYRITFDALSSSFVLRCGDVDGATDAIDELCFATNQEPGLAVLQR